MDVSSSEKESYWRGIAVRFESSGLSQSEFSRREGLVTSRLNYWLRKFGKSASSNSSFVELPRAGSNSAANFAEIELDFSSGLKLRIRG
jgi:hypothetical protein